MTMALAFIGFGANLGDCRANILSCWQRMGAHPAVTTLTLSSPYKTAPFEMDSENWFINCVGVIQTSLSPQDLLSKMLQLEVDLGRDRSLGMDRPVDLDILYYDDLVVMEPDLVIPHPEISKRQFVLTPLAEIAPDHIHPVLNQSSLALKRCCPAGDVHKEEWP